MQGILLLIKKPQNLPLLVLHLTFRQISMNSDRHLALSAFFTNCDLKDKEGKKTKLGIPYIISLNIHFFNCPSTFVSRVSGPRVSIS